MKATHTQLAVLSAAIGLSACANSEEATDTGDALNPLMATLLESGPASSVESSREMELDSTQAVYALGASMSAVLEPAEVSALLDEDDRFWDASMAQTSADLAPIPDDLHPGTGLLAPPAPAAMDCVGIERSPGSALVLDFDMCEGVQGQVTVERVESGLLVFGFQDSFVLGETDITGHVALQYQDRDEETTLFSVYTSDAQGQAGDPQASVHGDDGNRVSDLTLEGILSLDSVQETLELVGTGDVTTSGPYGSSDASYELGVDEQGEYGDPLTWPLGMDCACPSAGNAASTAEYLLERVTVDLDEFIELGDEDADWFEPVSLELDNPIGVSIAVTVSMTGECGEFEAQVEAEPIGEVSLSADAVRETIEAQCAELDGRAAQRACQELADAVDSDISVEVDEQLQQAAEDAIQDALQGELCKI